MPSKQHDHIPRSRLHTTAVQEIRWLSDLTFELRLTRPPGFDFSPGQYVLLPHGDAEGAYTMVSAPVGPTLDFCIRNTGGALTTYLSKLEPGERLEISDPEGYFTYEPSKRTAVLVATGTGLAPFVSYAMAGLADFILLHGVRRSDELYYRDELRAAARLYVPCLSHAGENVSSDGSGGRGRRVDGTVRGDSRSAAVGTPGDTGRNESGKIHEGTVTDYLARRLPRDRYDFYLCGRSEMIRDAILVIDDRFPGSLVYTETFY